MTVTTMKSVTAQQQDSVQTEEEGRNYSARTQSGGGSAWRVRRRCSLLLDGPHTITACRMSHAVCQLKF